MTTGVASATGAIFAAVQAVIEGTGTNAGIPGTYSADDLLRTALTFTPAAALASATSIVDAAGTWADNRWVRTNAPGYWLVCTAGNNALNARKVTAWTLSTTTFTIGSGFTYAFLGTETLQIMQGFARAPDEVDLRDDSTSGWDRYYNLEIRHVGVEPIYGLGQRTYRAELVVRLRLLKYGRTQDMACSMLENLRLLRDGLSQVNWESTYTRARMGDQGTDEIVYSDKTRMVGEMTMPFLYRVTR